MPCSPSELFKFASDLLDRAAGDEVILRTAGSKAYYAALHLVKETFAFEPRHQRLNHETSHGEVIGRATVYGKKDMPGRVAAAQIANQLDRLRRDRNDADYELDADFTVSHSRSMLERSQRILNLCGDVSRLRDQAQQA